MIDETNINSLANIIEMKLLKKEMQDNLKDTIELYYKAEYTKQEIIALIIGGAEPKGKEITKLWFNEIWDELYE